MAQLHRLLTEISRTRRRVVAERLLKGIALTAAVAVVTVLLSVYLLSKNNFSDSAIFWVRAVGAAAGLLVVGKWLLMPLLRRPSILSVARFLEERNPRLNDRLVTAVESLSASGKVNPAVLKLLVRDTTRRLSRVEKPAFFFPQTSLFSLLGFTACAALLMFLVFNGPLEVRYGLGKVFGTADSADRSLYSIQVQPGDTTIVRHGDLEIRAQLSGFSSDDVRLVAKYQSQPGWESVAMRPDPNDSDHVFLFFDVRERIDYYVEADGVRSPSFVVEVSDFPAIKELELSLDYPRHTGLSDTVQKDDGDLRALIGTEVTVKVRTDEAVKAGLLQFEGRGEVHLEVVDGDLLTGSFKIEADDFYRIKLQNLEGVWDAGSDEYVIEALEDQPPSAKITRPGRDKKVTNLEEIFIEASVEDDYGIRDVKLLYSVNGNAEEAIPLSIPAYPRSASASTTLYLEEFGLQPGDFISYYARARDARSEAVTDIYFLEVQPYDREYSQSQQSGGAGGGGGDDLQLAKFQKEIIAATFNVLREKAQLSEDEYLEDVQTVAQMQEQLRQQAITIQERIERRPATATPLFKKMVEYLKQAIVHMEGAHKELKEAKLAEAFPEEQKAYQKLLRSEALFKEIQISMGSEGGGGGSASAQELADMVDLELDQTKNQYETLQQNRSQQQKQELDEVAAKLKELAKRQQQEAERRKRMASQSSSSSGGGGSQQQLAEELEELARRLDRLSRQKRDQQLGDLGSQLRQAARDLKQSQEGNSQQNRMQEQEALQKMQRALQSLNQQRRSDAQAGMQQLVGESERIRQQQEDIVEQMTDLETREQEGQKDGEWYEDANSVYRDKQELAEDVLKLESDLHRSARQMESEQPGAARELKRAAHSIRDERVTEKMQEGSELLRRQWTMMARRREESVQEHLQELAQGVKDAQDALSAEAPGSKQDDSERALNQLGDLVENLESLADRAAGQASQQGQEGQQSQEGQEGREGRQGQEGQQGQEGRQGQQGQEGQQGQQGRQGQQGQEGQQGQQGQGGRQGREGQEGQQASEQGQSGSQPSGAGEGSESQGSRGPAGRASAMANSSGINPQQLEREWQERVGDAERIRDLLRNSDPRKARDIARIAAEMRRLDANRVLEDPEEVRQLRSQILSGFKQLELDLFRELAGDRSEELRLGYEEEIPPEFRARVEEYYRKLAGEENR